MIKIITVWSIAFALSTVAAIATAQQRFRYHDETETRPLTLQAATVDPGISRSELKESRTNLRVSANGIPDHLVGKFPNRGNPHQISEQKVNLKIPSNPKSNGSVTPLNLGWNFGVSLNGVAFDPLAAEFWQGNPRSGWSYNALGGAVALGLDENYAHVQPNGKYHYHGIPTSLIELLDYAPNRHSPLIGYAADGFPIYAMTGVVNGTVTQMTSSYRLKSGNRPGGGSPDGKHDGTFNEDYVYVAGAGNLEACNGAFTVSPEYPSGTYAYFLTEAYPVVPRCFAGTPDDSFRFGRR
ncbi:YHYH protein [Ruegeria sp. Ofav3-42]|uniref:YHYH protein n=1 Tax=Ruegeria sp. Ofav3-42 TaxID=2917759 RepID=UPI001EF49ED7|nr:YHYH protein [Ruegeria sp. Ofav3-42]MCG7519439.1 YHYH protein [Ruegeria sp. Ofav3-42]